MEQQKDKLSYSSIAKSELMQKKLSNKKAIICEIGAYIRICGSLNLGKGISIEVDKPAYAKRVFAHIKTVYGISPQIHLKKFNKLGKNYKYIVTVKDKEICQKILKDTYYLKNDGGYSFDYGIPKGFIKDDKLKQSFFRVVFILTGSISNPEKNYHLEFVFNNEEIARDLIKALNDISLDAKFTQRKNAYVVYLKDAEQIADFLTFIGATNSILKFYNIKIIKEMRNNVNRVVNCETANINKTIDAATRQLDSINTIKNKIGLDSLSEELFKVAQLRINNPEISLNEMVDLCGFHISKSGLNHRFKKIDQIADELK